MLPESLLLF